MHPCFACLRHACPGSGTTGDFAFLKFIPFPLGLTSVVEFHGMVGALINQGNQTLSDLRVLIYYISGFANILNQVKSCFSCGLSLGISPRGNAQFPYLRPARYFQGPLRTPELLE